jgi:hypothetical protein
MSTLRRIWEAWKKFGQMIGDFIGRFILTLFYFTIFVPFGLGVRLLADPLAIKGEKASHWIRRETQDRELGDARRLS